MTYQEAFEAKNEIVTLGAIHLPTGQIAACDPFFCADAIPFERHVEPGVYGVELRIVRSPGWGPRVACARIVFDRGGSVVQSEEAAIAPQCRNGYLVNSGLGSFMDESTRASFSCLLSDFYSSKPEGNYYTDVLAEELREQTSKSGYPGNSGNWAMHKLPDTNLDVAIFASGLGDGAYQSFWGLDQNGDPVFLLTDFRLL
jgi:hypothetical protein